MPTHGGFLSFTRAFVGLSLLLSGGCVRDAVLENRVRAALERDAVLATSTDLTLAEAALAAQLVELEALAQRGAGHRVLELLGRSYGLWADGFVEARRLEAVVSGDGARAERERQRHVEADARSREYGRVAGTTRASSVAPYLASADAACQARDAVAYERELNALLARVPRDPSENLRLALAQRVASSWLMPRVAERCRPAVALPPAPAATSG